MKVKVSHSQTLNEFSELDMSLATQKGREWTVGRSPEADLVLDSPDVSRLHGKFFFQGGNYYFCDFGSRNGSIVNGKLAVTNQAYILRDGDIIRIGDFTLMMEEIISLSQQAETVVRIINPSQFSNWRSIENADNASVENKTPEVVSSDEVKTPVAQQLVQTSGEAEIPDIANAASVEVEEVSSDVTFIQSQDTAIQVEEITRLESTIQPSAASQAPEVISNEATDIANQAAVGSSSAEIVSPPIPEIGEHSDFTYVQPRNIIDQSSEVEEVLDYTIVQPRNIIEVSSERTTLQSSSEADAVAAPEVVSSHAPQSKTEAPEVVSSDAAPESEDVALNQVELEIIDVSTQSEEREEETVSEVTTIPESESVSETNVLSSDVEEVSETDLEQSEEISETSVSEYPDLSQKRIVIIAHESKKSELADFVSEHQKFFSLCHTITWSSVSELLHQQAGIAISEQISAGTSGGYQTIASLVNSGDISAVIFLKDFLQPQPGQANEDAMLRLCNINQVLVATNVATAKALVHYITHTS